MYISNFIALSEIFLHPINLGIIDEWQIPRNFDLRTVCEKATLNYLIGEKKTGEK